MTPPKSLHGSLENLEAGTLGGPSNEPVDLVVENDWIADEDLGEVTGEPTKEHWKVSKIPYLIYSHRICQKANTCAANIIYRLPAGTS